MVWLGCGSALIQFVEAEFTWFSCGSDCCALMFDGSVVSICAALVHLVVA